MTSQERHHDPRGPGGVISSALQMKELRSEEVECLPQVHRNKKSEEPGDGRCRFSNSDPKDPPTIFIALSLPVLEVSSADRRDWTDTKGNFFIHCV